MGDSGPIDGYTDTRELFSTCETFMQDCDLIRIRLTRA